MHAISAKRSLTASKLACRRLLVLQLRSAPWVYKMENLETLEGDIMLSKVNFVML